MVLKKCCLVTTGGFYFNVYYTTWRKHDVLINVWCSDLVEITDRLKSFNPQWATLANRDAVKRLTSFFSKLEKGCIKAELISNHLETWEANNKCLRTYFKKATFDSVVKLVRTIDIAQFPTTFNPYVHTPEAMEGTLFEYGELLIKQEACDKAIRAAEARAEKAEARVATAEARAKRAESGGGPRPRPRRENPSRNNQNRTPTKDTTVTSHDLSGHTPDVKRLMRPGKKGQVPCLACAQKGFRLFHDVCDPERLAENIKRRAERRKSGKSQQPTFPPPEDKRKHPLNTYADSLCTHCKREDVDPKYARHPSDTCFRRPGGECDKEGAKSRSARHSMVRKLSIERTKSRQQPKGTRTTQKAERYVRTSHMAVRVHAPEASSADAV